MVYRGKLYGALTNGRLCQADVEQRQCELKPPPRLYLGIERAIAATYGGAKCKTGAPIGESAPVSHLGCS